MYLNLMLCETIVKGEKKRKIMHIKKVQKKINNIDRNYTIVFCIVENLEGSWHSRTIKLQNSGD